MTTFFGYIRVSTGEQAISGLSLVQQERRIRAYTEALGDAAAHVYVDAGVSGLLSPSKRPGFVRLLAAIKELRARPAAIVVYRLDRIGRNAREVLNLEHELRRLRVRLASVTESFDSGTPGGKAYLGLLTVFAEYEAGLIGERTHVAMRASLSPTLARVGGPAPFGYRNGQDGLYVPEPSEAMVVQQIFRDFTACRSFSAVAAHLNATGTFTRAGASWTHASVGDILRNVRTYTGDRIWGRHSRRNGPRPPTGWSVQRAMHAPLLASDLALTVEAILGERRRRRERRRAQGEAQR